METSTTNQVTAITPVLTKDVSFTDKVKDVETALKGRSAAQREIKTKWAAVVKLLQQYDLSVPYRRPDPSTVVGYIKEVKVYQAQPEIAEDMKPFTDYITYRPLSDINQLPQLRQLLEQRFSGFAAWLEDVRVAREASCASRELDKDATQAAREEMSQAVDAYLASLEAYDETLDSVANVKEYIGIVKEIAGISAIAQGIGTNN